MASINNNLYPPICATYMPAFDRTDECRVYFSISPYNSLNNLHHSSQNSLIDAVQIIIKNQKTNQSVLNQNLYPSGIKLCTLFTDQDRETDDKYYVVIYPTDIQGYNLEEKTGFNLNQYYKVQIRFTGINASNPTIENGYPVNLDSWLSENINFFSQWSTVCLIRPISFPILSIKGFNSNGELTTFSSQDIDIVGKITFSDETDKEMLKSYNIKLYDSNNILLYNSGEIYSDMYNNVNQIKHRIKYECSSDDEYILVIQIVTNNFYSYKEPLQFPFLVQKVEYDNISQINFVATADNVGGRIQLHAYADRILDNIIRSDFIIRRSSNKSNFLIWEDIHLFSFLDNNNPINVYWYDTTVEAGVWYLYKIFKINKKGYKSNQIKIKEPIMTDFQDIFLTGNNKILKIRFDPQINSFSHTISETKTDTIGSKYPFIRRNGNINYRTFSLSGTITFLMDIAQNFMHIPQDLIYEDVLQEYKKYKNQNNITFNNYIYEKDFRNEVINFLYENNVKLFRSMSQGNILVKLMNVSFTPNKNLSRMIYSFSCTAYQIDQCSIEKYDYYNIQKIGSFINQKQKQEQGLKEVLGQISSPDYNNITYNQNMTNSVYINNYFTKGINIISQFILPKYKKYNSENYYYDLLKIKYLKIKFLNAPYLIKIVNNIPVKIEENANIDDIRKAVTKGYILCIGAQDSSTLQYIIVNQSGIYQLTDSNTQITYLSFPYDKQQAIIDFIIDLQLLQQQEQESSVNYSIINKIGQFWGSFYKSDSLSNKIMIKYQQTFETPQGQSYKQAIQKIIGVRVYAAPDTIIYVKEKKDSDYERHIIKDTGLLEFYDEQTDIQDLYFFGKHFQQLVLDNQNEDQKYVIPKDGEFIETNLIINKINDLVPKKNRVYILTTFVLIKKELNDTTDINQDNIIQLTEQQIKPLSQIYQDILIGESVTFDNVKTQIADSLISKINTDEKIGVFLTNNYKILIKRNEESLFKRYIFYNNNWNEIDLNNDVSFNVFQAIVDYYCKIIQERIA